MHRLEENPILTPEDVAPSRDDLDVYCTLNPAAVRVGAQVLLLVRVGERPIPEEGYVAHLYFDAESGETLVERIARDDPDLTAIDERKYLYRGKILLTSLSHLRIARGPAHGPFTFDMSPAIYPATPYEAYGCEDARVTPLEGEYLVTYTAVSRHGVCVALAATQDFVTFERRGLIFPTHQKDVCIFPQRVGGRYVCRHRPFRTEFNDACIWTAESPDLLSWGRHAMTLSPREGTWEAGRVGAGAPPIRTDEGWLDVYHAADAAGRYALGAMLSAPDRPANVICRSSRPILEPEAAYERTGVYADCVFSNGLVVEDDGAVTVYYGAADRVCAAAVTTVTELLVTAKS